MWRPNLPILLALVCIVVAFAGWSLASTGEPGFEQGKAPFKSVGALEMGPDGILFVGDSQGSAVVALELPAPSKKTPKRPPGPITDLDSKIAALLGAEPREVFIEDMAADPDSGAVYLSVMSGSGNAARPAIVQVSTGGEIALVPLNDIRYSRLELPNAPEEGAKLYRWKSRSLTITDLELIDGELYIAGLANEEFASTLRRASFPFQDKTSTVGLEIYHGAHGAYETFAPIFSFTSTTIDGEKHLLAGYLCTPLVTFSMDDVRTKARLRGKTIAELGWGNIPTDILSYEHGGEGYVLIANSSRGTMKLRATDIAKAQKGPGITTGAEPRSGVDYHTVPLGSVVQIADFDADSILVLRRQLDNGSLSLDARNKSRL